MSQVNRTKKVETEDENIIDNFLQHFSEKYNVSKDLLATSIDINNIKYKLERYKFKLDDIDNDIEAEALNSGHTDKAQMENIISGIKKFLEELDKKDEENIINRNINLNSNAKKQDKKKQVPNILNLQSKHKTNPAKNINDNIPINSKVTTNYTSTIAFNEGNNKMESKFNKSNVEVDINQLKLIDDYQLLPKDSMPERIGYENYFQNFKNNLLEELKISPDDPLLGETKFVLFVAFDIIDAKPTFDDLVGIDPLNDYKKYVLKINTNNDNLFLVSGQIIYLEGELIENGKTIEVREIINGFKIIAYAPNYESISDIYSNAFDPFALYCMFGPYFSKDDYDLSVFNNVIREVARKDPHYFVINGPFFSTENTKVKYGEIDTEKGMENILSLLRKEFSKTRTKLIICPGISDNENYYPLPQPPFNKVNEHFNLYTNQGFGPEIIFVSNPQIFQFNDAFIG